MKSVKFALVLMLLVLVVADAQAFGRRSRSCTTCQPQAQFRYYQPQYFQPTYPPTVIPTGGNLPITIVPESSQPSCSTCPNGRCTQPPTLIQPSTVIPAGGIQINQTFNFGTGDGLDEVNAKRASRGLRPFLRDPGLTQAAHAAASFRAQHLLFGHTSNDFGFLPPGANAASAGCAAYPASYGWMSCCTYEGYTYAGAAYVTGRDGKRYMHLFVR